ncbi:efflux RND transporter periplasmic adaptor subunit [Xanthobacter autotrophicus]|uniref:efflux RND transporter periplasmic adaptor subunit n=1 Tax=Xanthobacter TaxID=279 RepID=UPI0024ABC5E1|nr:efflux RND transporter periplasmic adaptor subunit [Xanthobacter autotrophicus]MDI4663000.1 efflux RND transporter periplasmic adaptor subunit [Xanthobacter autotrophicus]
MAATVMGCDEAASPNTQARPVRTLAVGGSAEGETVSLTGQVRAKDQVSLAFRLDGRMIERSIRVGDVVSPGQVVARLDANNQQNALRTAQANLASAQAVLTQARLTYQRQEQLSKGGWATRARFDEAVQSLRSAEAQVESAQAQLHTAQDQLSYTVLSADGAGAVTAVGAEPGEVIRAGQMVVEVARQGGRDAVFDVSEQIIRTSPRDVPVEIALTDDPKVRATGRVREVAPQADSVTRTFQVKVEIMDPPEAMHLGSTVTGKIRLAPPPGIEVPASALTEANAGPAVWVVDPQSQTVSLRRVDVLRYDQAMVVISGGLETGELVVTAGVHALRPGQKVRLSGAAS